LNLQNSLESDGAVNSGGSQSDRRLLIQLTEGILTSHVRLDRMEEELKKATAGAVVKEIREPAASIQQTSDEWKKQLQDLHRQVGEWEKLGEHVAKLLEEAAALGTKTAYELFGEMKEHLRIAIGEGVTQNITAPSEAIGRASDQITARAEQLREQIAQLETFAVRMDHRLEAAARSGAAGAHQLMGEMSERVADAAREAVNETIAQPAGAVARAGKDISDQSQRLGELLEELEIFSLLIEERLKAAAAQGAELAQSLFGTMETRLLESASSAIRLEISGPANEVREAAQSVSGQSNRIAEQLGEWGTLAENLEGGLLASAREGVTQGMQPGLDEQTRLNAEFAEEIRLLAARSGALNDTVNVSARDGVVQGMEPGLAELERLSGLLAERGDQLYQTRAALDTVERRLSRDLPLALHNDLATHMNPLLKGLEAGTKTTVWNAQEILNSLDLLSNAHTARFVELADLGVAHQNGLIAQLEALDRAYNTAAQEGRSQAQQLSREARADFIAQISRARAEMDQLELSLQQFRAELLQLLQAKHTEANRAMEAGFVDTLKLLNSAKSELGDARTLLTATKFELGETRKVLTAASAEILTSQKAATAELIQTLQAAFDMVGKQAVQNKRDLEDRLEQSKRQNSGLLFLSSLSAAVLAMHVIVPMLTADSPSYERGTNSLIYGGIIAVIFWIIFHHFAIRVPRRKDTKT
jgi:hypothetical protein